MIGRNENAASVACGGAQASAAMRASTRVSGRLALIAVSLLVWASAAGAISGVGKPAGGDAGVRAGFSASIDRTVKGKTPSLTHHSKGVLDGSDIANRGIVVVAAGAIHNDTDSDGLLDAGESIAYHYTVLNAGQSGLSALSVTDSMGTVVCPQTALAPGAHMICTRTYVVTAGDQTAGAVGNQVNVSGLDAASRPVQAADAVLTQNLGGRAGIRVFKSPDVLQDVDASNSVTAGDVLRYTFVIKNSNAETLGSVGLTEPDPSRIDTPISCAPTTLAGLPFGVNGAGVLTASDVVTCTANYTVRGSDVVAGEVVNLVQVSAIAPVAGQVEGTGASLVVIPLVQADLGVLKTGPTTIVRGESLVFTIRVENRGPNTAFNARLTDPTPPGLIFVSTAGACTGPFPCALGNLTNGAVRTLTVTYLVPTDYAGPDMIVNTVNASSDSVDPTPGDSSSSSSVLVTGQPNLALTKQVPVDARWALLLLAGLVMLIASRRIER